MSTEETWYTITVVQHAKHPQRYVENDTDKPVEVIACTVLPHLAGDVLRAAADQIAPKKPVMRARPRNVFGLLSDEERA